MFGAATTALFSAEAAGMFTVFLHTVHELHMMERAYEMSRHTVGALRGHHAPPSGEVATGEINEDLTTYYSAAVRYYQTLFQSESELLKAVKFFDGAMACCARRGQLQEVKSKLNLYQAHIVRFREALLRVHADDRRAVYLYAFSDDSHSDGLRAGLDHLIACNNKQAAIQRNLAHIQESFIEQLRYLKQARDTPPTSLTLQGLLDQLTPYYSNPQPSEESPLFLNELLQQFEGRSAAVTSGVLADFVERKQQLFTVLQDQLKPFLTKEAAQQQALIFHRQYCAYESDTALEGKAAAIKFLVHKKLPSQQVNQRLCVEKQLFLENLVVEAISRQIEQIASLKAGVERNLPGNIFSESMSIYLNPDLPDAGKQFAKLMERKLVTPFAVKPCDLVLLRTPPKAYLQQAIELLEIVLIFKRGSAFCMGYARVPDPSDPSTEQQRTGLYSYRDEVIDDASPAGQALLKLIKKETFSEGEAYTGKSLDAIKDQTIDYIVSREGGAAPAKRYATTIETITRKLAAIRQKEDSDEFQQDLKKYEKAHNMESVLEQVYHEIELSAFDCRYEGSHAFRLSSGSREVAFIALLNRAERFLKKKKTTHQTRLLQLQEQMGQIELSEKARVIDFRAREFRETVKAGLRFDSGDANTLCVRAMREHGYLLAPLAPEPAPLQKNVLYVRWDALDDKLFYRCLDPRGSIKESNIAWETLKELGHLSESQKPTSDSLDALQPLRVAILAITDGRQDTESFALHASDFLALAYYGLDPNTKDYLRGSADPFPIAYEARNNIEAYEYLVNNGFDDAQPSDPKHPTLAGAQGYEDSVQKYFTNRKVWLGSTLALTDRTSAQPDTGSHRTGRLDTSLTEDEGSSSTDPNEQALVEVKTLIRFDRRMDALERGNIMRQLEDGQGTFYKTRLKPIVTHIGEYGLQAVYRMNRAALTDMASFQTDDQSTLWAQFLNMVDRKMFWAKACLFSLFRLNENHKGLRISDAHIYDRSIKSIVAADDMKQLIAPIKSALSVIEKSKEPGARGWMGRSALHDGMEQHLKALIDSIKGSPLGRQLPNFMTLVTPLFIPVVNAAGESMTMEVNKAAIPADGTCGFYALACLDSDSGDDPHQYRGTVCDFLLAASLETEDYAALAREMVEIISDDGENRETLFTLLGELSPEDREEVERLTQQWLNPNASHARDDHARGLRAFLATPARCRQFIEKGLAQDLWIGFQSIRVYAKHAQKSVFIYQEKKGKLVRMTFDGNAATDTVADTELETSIKLLFNGRNHFDRLLVARSKEERAFVKKFGDDRLHLGYWSANSSSPNQSDADKKKISQALELAIYKDEVDLFKKEFTPGMELLSIKATLIKIIKDRQPFEILTYLAKLSLTECGQVVGILIDAYKNTDTYAQEDILYKLKKPINHSFLVEVSKLDQEQRTSFETTFGINLPDTPSLPPQQSSASSSGAGLFQPPGRTDLASDPANGAGHLTSAAP